MQRARHVLDEGKQYLERAPKTMRNNNTAWWDASQIYGYDESSLKRVKRDPADPRQLLLMPHLRLYLPLFEAGDPINPEWTGQEATAFPDNWTIGISFSPICSRASITFSSTSSAHCRADARPPTPASAIPPILRK